MVSMSVEFTFDALIALMIALICETPQVKKVVTMATETPL